MRILKASITIILVCAIAFLTGCGGITPTTTQLGPDRWRIFVGENNSSIPACAASIAKLNEVALPLCQNGFNVTEVKDKEIFGKYLTTCAFAAYILCNTDGSKKSGCQNCGNGFDGNIIRQ